MARFVTKDGTEIYYKDWDTYADDLAKLFDALDLDDAVIDRTLHRRRRGGALHRSSTYRR